MLRFLLFYERLRSLARNNIRMDFHTVWMNISLVRVVYFTVDSNRQMPTIDKFAFAFAVALDAITNYIFDGH